MKVLNCGKEFWNRPLPGKHAVLRVWSQRKVRWDGRHLLFFTNLFLTASCLTLYSLSLFLSFVISAPIDLPPNSFFHFSLFPFFILTPIFLLTSLTFIWLPAAPDRLKWKTFISDLLHSLLRFMLCGFSFPDLHTHLLQTTHRATDCSESSSVTSSLGEEWFKTDGPLLRQQPSVNSSSSWIKS